MSKEKDEEETFDVVVTFCTNIRQSNISGQDFQAKREMFVCPLVLLSFKRADILLREIEGNTYGFMATRFLPFYIFS